MKVAVSGPRGFIASRLLKRLATDSSIQVLTIDRGMDLNQLPQFFQEQKFDAIVHLATQFLKTHEYSQIKGLVESNVALSTQLLECATQAGVKKFIHFGTYYQYPKPASLYAATKAAMEPIIDYYASKSKTEHTILYLYDTYGPGDTRAKILNFLFKAARSGEKLPLSPGLQNLKLLHVDDVCAAIESVLKSTKTGQNGPNRYAVEPKELLTLKEIAQRVEVAAGSKIQAEWGAREYTPGVPMNPEIPYPALPGWSAQISLDQGLGEMAKTC